MIYGIPPSEFKEADVEKLVESMLEKKPLFGKPLEYVSGKCTIWMPYYRIRYEYTRSKDDLTSKFGETALAETALNAMFGSCVRNESELFTLFRPSYLKHKMTTYQPRPNEKIWPPAHIDCDAVLSTFLSRLNEVQDEVREVRSALNKHYAHTRRYSIILPATLRLKEADKLSRKIARLEATANVLRLCLNLNENAKTIEVLDNNVFHYPTVVVALRRKDLETERFIIVDLVKKGSMLKRLNHDNGLTKLSSKNDACRDLLAKSIAQQ